MNAGKSKKKRIPLHESGANNLDNAAPIKSIVEELQHKNPNAYKFYCQVLGKLPVSAPSNHCTVVGHNLATFPSDWDGELPEDYFEPFAYRCNLPKFMAPPRHISVRDPVAEYLLVKKKWIDKSWFMQRLSSRKMELLMEGYKRLSPEVVRCPQYLVEMAAHAQREPDPRFQSHFNWYYAGRGNLHCVRSQHHHYLVHSELTCLYLTRCHKNDMVPNFNETFSFDCGEKNFILETNCSTQNMVIALRTMNKVFLLKVEDNEDPTLHVTKTFESKVAYTSIEFDHHHQNILYITSLDDTVDIVNLNTGKSKSVILNKEPDHLNNWNTVQSFDRLHYVHTTKKAIHIFDKRTHTKAFTIKNHKVLCDECNEISVIRKSERIPHCFYYGTNHHLFCVDVRSNSSLKPTVLSRWTHGMECPPVHISVNDYEAGKELVTLSSQWPEDVTIVVNDAAHLNAGMPPDCMVMPYKPRTIFDSLNEARTKKLCLDPTLYVDRRLSTAITGLLVRENDENFEIYVQNSLGDISVQTLFPEHLESVARKDFSKELEEWTKYLRVVPEKFQVTEVVDLSALLAHSRNARPSGSDAPRRRKSRVKFSENSIMELFESERFDDGLLEAWNLEGLN